MLKNNGNTPYILEIQIWLIPAVEFVFCSCSLFPQVHCFDRDNATGITENNDSSVLGIVFKKFWPYEKTMIHALAFSLEPLTAAETDKVRVVVSFLLWILEDVG